MGNYPPLCDAVKARLEDFQFLLRYKLYSWSQPSLTEIKKWKTSTRLRNILCNKEAEQIIFIANRWQTVSFIKKSHYVRQGGGTRYLSDHWGVSALSLSSVQQQQHGLCSSREPCTTKAEEEDTGDVIFTLSDSSLLLLPSLVIAWRESSAAQIKENLQPAFILPYIIL